MMKILTVDLGARSYPILIGPCLAQPDLVRAHLQHAEILIVTNATVAPLYLSKVVDLLSGPANKICTLVLPDGESHKSLEVVNRIYSCLLENNFSRQAALVALGGGVVGDMTGFAAATYQRGVDFYQIPTTLLAQVDSSVGGKTGVNHPLAKNMIGAFKQPKAVFIDPSVLQTLPSNEFSAGFAEAIKHGVIRDADYFQFLADHLTGLFALNADLLGELIFRSCRIKADVVAADETEQGVRAILNLGHTFGHAIETTLGYGEWLHGEAVAAGLAMATHMSVASGLCPASDQQQIIALLRAAQLPVMPPTAMTSASFKTAMLRDKKVIAGSLRLVLIRGLGDAFVTADFSPQVLEQTLSHFCD